MVENAGLENVGRKVFSILQFRSHILEFTFRIVVHFSIPSFLIILAIMTIQAVV